MSARGSLPLWGLRRRLTPPPPGPFRRGKGDEAPLGAGLLIGCLIGAGLSWQAILSEGARRQLFGALIGQPGVADAASIPPARAPAVQPAPGMIEGAQRSSGHAPATSPYPGTGLPADPEPLASRAAKQGTGSLPERLVLAEKEAGVPLRPVVTGAPELGVEVVFDVNSSFLGPAAIAALRRLVVGLPQAADPAVHRLALRAAVSGDGVKGADAKEAERYNRWLAERRVGRVAEWLRQNLPGQLAIEAEFVGRDPSRRVTVSPRSGR